MTDPTKIFIYVNDKKTSLAAYLAMDPKTVKTVDAIGCTALTELRADAAKTVYAIGCTALTELRADAAEAVYANGCTALTELRADAAKTVYASGCTALTELRADAAKTVYASGCTALRSHKIIHGGTDKRGYGFSAINLRGAWRIVAGCRNFTPEQAIAHWSSPGKSAECLALAKELIAKIDEQAKSEGT